MNVPKPWEEDIVPEHKKSLYTSGWYTRPWGFSKKVFSGRPCICLDPLDNLKKHNSKYELIVHPDYGSFPLQEWTTTKETLFSTSGYMCVEVDFWSVRVVKRGYTEARGEKAFTAAEYWAETIMPSKKVVKHENI